MSDAPTWRYKRILNIRVIVIRRRWALLSLPRGIGLRAISGSRVKRFDHHIDLALISN